MDLEAFRKVLDSYITDSLREDEAKRAKRPYLIDPEWEGITDPKIIEEIDQLKEYYETEEYEIRDYIGFLKDELKAPYGDYISVFQSFCDKYQISDPVDSDNHKLWRREYLKAEIHIKEVTLERARGHYEIDDSNRISDLKIDKSLAAQGAAQSKQMQRFGKGSGYERSIMSDPSFGPFKDEVLRLHAQRPDLSARGLAEIACRTAPVPRTVGRMETYIPKILEGTV
jgi:hypothetical protein